MFLNKYLFKYIYLIINKRIMSTFSNNFGKVLLENNIFKSNLGNISKAGSKNLF